MIDHIYTGEIPEDLKAISEDLIYLAVKYNLPNLVKACEVSLLKTLSEDNAIKTLINIDKYKPTSNIRQDILKYITINALDIIDTEDWQSSAHIQHSTGHSQIHHDQLSGHHRHGRLAELCPHPAFDRTFSNTSRSTLWTS